MDGESIQRPPNDNNNTMQGAGMNKVLIGLLDSIKGNPLSLLFYLRAMGGKAGTNELVSISGISQPTVTKAMNKLVSLDLVTRPDYFGGWVLSENAFDKFDGSKQKFFGLPYSSSSYLINMLLLLLTTTKAIKQKDFVVAREVKEFLSSRGVWPKRIVTVAQAVNNDLPLLEAHFRNGADTALVVHRILNEIPPEKPKHLTQQEVFEKYTGGDNAKYIEQ